MDDDWKHALDNQEFFYQDRSYGTGMAGRSAANKAKQAIESSNRQHGVSNFTYNMPVVGRPATGGGSSGGGGGGNVGAGGAPGVTNLQQQFEASLKNRPDDIFMQKLKGMATDGESFNTSDPSYKWRFEQGQQAVERSAAAKGLLGSGNVLQELQAYGQGAASQEFGAQFQRMLQGTHEASSQYDLAFGQLAKLANIDLGYGQLDVSRQNAETARQQVGVSEMGALASLSNAGTNWQESQFKMGQARDQEAGIRDALQGMAFSPPTGGGYTPNATGTSLPPYSPSGNTSYYSTTPASGWWSSSSGGGGSF